jgi:HEAT repeat protein/beta-lactamase regulating signal transducer with metallopeptidase domain
MIASTTTALLAGTLLKGTLLLLATGVVARLLRRSSAATRHIAWTAGIVGLLAMPFLTTIVPWRIPVLPAVPTRSTPLSHESPEVIPVTIPMDAAPASEDAAPLRAVAEPRLRTEPGEAGTAPGGARTALDGADLVVAIAVVWALGALLVLGRLVAGVFVLARSARRARAASGPAWSAVVEHASRRLALERPVPVLLSDDVAMPLVAGVLRPRVVLPAAAESWTDERRRAVLAHELAHVRRGDLMPHLAAWIACALWWFHPLVWVAARRLRAESERACDDLVLGLGTRASDYAQHLLQIVSSVRSARRVPAVVLPLARRSEFEGRVLAILEPGIRRGGTSRLGASAAIAAIALLALPLAAVVPERGTTVIAASSDTPAAGAATSDFEVDADVDNDSDVEPADQTPMPMPMPMPTLGMTASASATASASSSAMAGDTGGVSAALIAGLTRALGDSNTETRLDAATALGEIEDPRAVAALSRALRQDSDAGVRAAAAWALGEIEDPAGVPALAQALREDRDIGVRRMAVWALGEIESSEAVPALAAALRDDDVEMRRKAAWALGEIEDATAVPALSAALRDDRDLEVRQTALWALGEIEDPSAIPALTAALRDSDVEMRRKAAWALGEIESPAAIPALTAAIRDADPEVRKTAVWALAEIDTPAAYEALVPLLESDDPEIRRLAVQAIAHQ